MVATITMSGQPAPLPDFERLPFAPRRAICYRTSTPLQIDGRLEDRAWSAEYRSTPGRYADDLAVLNVRDIHVDGIDFTPSLHMTDSLYELRAPGFDDAVVHLRHDGRVWVTRGPRAQKE